LENKKPISYKEIEEGWKELGESYFLLENLSTKERIVYKGFEGMSLYIKWKRHYGAALVKLSRLDKAVGEVLYGAVQD
jgi:hypothetical protein